MQPLPRTPPVAPPGSGHDPPAPAATRQVELCAAWSRHAAELALALSGDLQRWEETPTTAAMVGRGELARLLPGIFLPPDLLGTAVRRALAIGCALGEDLRPHHVLAGPTAAWVHLGGVPPAPVELLSSAHRSVLVGVVLRQARLVPGEIDTLGGAPVTAPRRTAVDLLRFSPEVVAAPLLRRLERAGLVEAEEVRAHLHRLHRHPGVEAARARLARILGPVPEPPDQPAAATDLIAVGPTLPPVPTRRAILTRPGRAAREPQAPGASRAGTGAVSSR